MSAGVPVDRLGSRRLDDALAFRLHRTNRLLRTHLLRLLREHGEDLTPEQYFLLSRLRERERVRQVDLAEPVLGDPPNVSRLLDALARRGLAQRSTDPDDRRSSLASLTAAGRQLADTLHSVVVEQRTAVFAGLDSSELDTLASLLDRVDGNVERLLGDAGPQPRRAAVPERGHRRARDERVAGT